MKFKKIVKENARDEWEDLKRHWTASSKPKGQKEFDQASEWNKAHPEITCDRCGFTSRNEDYFEIAAGGDIVCDDCRHKMAMTNEAKKKRVSKEEDNWYGIKDAKFIYHGDYSDPEVEYKGVSLNYWAIQDGLWEVFKDENPEGTEKEFDKWMETHPEEVKSELDLQYDAEIGNQDDELEEFDEGWLGDKMKAGWEKVKSGAKKVGKAIGDAFNGPFRKGDQIVMKGEDGESFKGTITDYSMSDRTYEVMLGKQTNEGLEEDVLCMPDRVEELDEEIDRLWRRLGDVDDKTVSRLILACIELEKLEPGRLVDALQDYANFTEK